MSVDRVKELVRAAVEDLVSNDATLLQNDVGEQAITHQLATYLVASFDRWNVDCEYNRNLDTVKRLKYALHPNGDIEERRVVPDIIIHRRGTTENLVAIEVKKSTNPEPDEFDIRKLDAFVSQLNYSYALFLRLKAGSNDVGVERECWIEDA